MTSSLLIAIDTGNRKLKYRLGGQGWVAEDALVRPVAQMTDDLQGERLTPFTYLEGPAEIDRHPDTGKLQRRPYLVGRDAIRGGQYDLSRVGTAAHRVASDPYKAETLYAIARSLPEDVTHTTPEPQGRRGKPKPEPKRVVEADIAFVGGLPGESAAFKPELLAWLKGAGKNTRHVFTLGDVEFRLRVERALIIAQHIAVAASLSFSEAGRALANGALQRKRLILDPGGGTTDYGGNVALEVIAGTEGTVRKAAYEIAALARELVQAAYPGLQVSVLDMLAAMDMAEPIIFKAGEPLSVSPQLLSAADTITLSVLTDVTPRWEPHLSQAEVAVAGGTGQWMLPTVKREFRGVKVELLPDAIFRVGWGLERFGRFKLTGGK